LQNKQTYCIVQYIDCQITDKKANERKANVVPVLIFHLSDFVLTVALRHKSASKRNYNK
ncbi:hypothetical protein T11_16614, partial [Trichinella zimbabwensis]